MKFKVDENLPLEIKTLLNEAGHNTATVFDENLSGTPDENLIQHCLKEGRALITLDLDFANIRLYPPQLYSGLVVMRLRYLDKKHILDVAKNLIPILLKESLDKKLWIVEEDRLRIRA